MGAVIGGVYAAAQLDVYFDWARDLRKADIVRLLDFSFTWTSVFKGEKIFDALRELLGECCIEDLDRGFTAVATSLKHRREVWIEEGSLFSAIRASSAVPGVFAPVEINGDVLIDGGLVNPIPIAPTLNDATDLTIAVNLNAVQDVPAEEQAMERDDSDNEPGHAEAIRQFLDNLVSGERNDREMPDAADILTESIDIMQGTIARFKLAAYSPDVVIDVSRDACSFFEFHRASELRDIGYRRAEEALDRVVD